MRWGEKRRGEMVRRQVRNKEIELFQNWEIELLRNVHKKKSHIFFVTSEITISVQCSRNNPELCGTSKLNIFFITRAYYSEKEIDLCCWRREQTKGEWKMMKRKVRDRTEKDIIQMWYRIVKQGTTWNKQLTYIV